MPAKKMKHHNDDVAVVLEDSCNTVSGKSELVFNIGKNSSEQLFIRIKSNSGGGYFDDSWLPMNSILDLLAKVDSEDGFSSFAISGLTRGRSANTPGFLAGALKKLGIIKTLEGKHRRYELGDVEGFLSMINQLQQGGGPTSSKPKAKAKVSPRPKTSAKTPRKSTTRRKKSS